MSTKKQTVVYRLPKQGYEEIDPEEWSDMAICDAYDIAVSEKRTEDKTKSHDVKPKNKQLMQNSLRNTNRSLGEGDHQSPQSTHTESHNGRKRNHKEDSPVKAERSTFKPGDYCIALFSEDGLYYPCTIVSVDSTKKACLVEYDGYGNKEHVNSCDIFTEKEWESKSNQQIHSECNDDVKSGSSSSASCFGTGTSSSTDGTSSDVTQDIYSDSRGRRKRCDGKRGRHCKHDMEPPFNFPFPNFGPSSFFGMPPPPPIVSHKSNPDLSDDTLSSMLMSWYMAGYHTGYYQGICSKGRRKSKK